MKTIYLAGGAGSNTAIKVMTHHLTQHGHRVTRDPKDPEGWDVTVRWGTSYGYDKPALNAHVNKYDKYDGMIAQREAGVPVPKTASMDSYARYLPYPTQEIPWLARKRHHSKGKDIVVCPSLSVAKQVADAREHDFFSLFIPTETEYRVWTFQNKAFAVYEKEYKGEGEYEGFMRNRRFGFKFVKHDELLDTEALTKPSVDAVKAIDMDFGAVDVLKGKDGKYYVLEVNSMPHIDTIERSSGIRLAKHISNWAEKQ